MAITPNDPANFTPARGSYKELSPFRFWCQKVLPLVYDDSLSYYELLNKVVNYLNMAMEDVTTLEGDVTNLHTAYVQLQTYVNDYFVSLDVQQEINNKLNEMAANGELNELIDPLLPDLISSWLDEHLTPTTPTIDDTLTIRGAGADAKTVGDTINEINGDLSEVISDLSSIDNALVPAYTEGQTLTPTTNNGWYISTLVMLNTQNNQDFKVSTVPVERGKRYRLRGTTRLQAEYPLVAFGNTDVMSVGEQGTLIILGSTTSTTSWGGINSTPPLQPYTISPGRQRAACSPSPIRTGALKLSMAKSRIGVGSMPL